MIELGLIACPVSDTLNMELYKKVINLKIVLGFFFLDIPTISV